MLIDILHRTIRRRFHRLGFRSQWTESPAGLVHYYEYGPPSSPRQTIVLLHGLGTSSSTWVHIIPLLTDGSRVVAIDLPGFGFSPPGRTKHWFSLKELNQTLDSVIPRIVPESPVLIGHSLGGWLAADYAIRHPGSVDRLILIDPAGLFYPGAEEQKKLFETRNLRTTLRLLTNLWFRYPWYFKPFAPAILHDLRKRGVPEFVESIEQQDFLNERLHRLSIPVHGIWGREDKITPVWSAEILRNHVPRLTVEFIDRCGHVPQLERPGELAQLLMRLLKDGEKEE